jgi:hypothetical protein
MPLPPDFDEWQHLQSLVRSEHNKAVRNYFKNQPDNDISTPKRSLKHACLIKETDTVDMISTRQWLFEVTCGHTQSIQTPIYGVPVQELQTQFKFKPQVKLFFLEAYDQEIHDSGLPQAQGEITFRLMSKSSETITRSDAESLAKKIKEVFGTPRFTWEKGWYKSTYLDQEKGYDLRLLVRNKAEAERVIQHVLQIQEHTFNRDCFQYIEHERSYPINPGIHQVYGRAVKKPVRRRRADVKFQFAQLLVWGLVHPINLVATSNSYKRKVIERV